METTVQIPARAVRIVDGLKVATLRFSDGTVLDRFVVRVNPTIGQYMVYDNLSGSLMYSRHMPGLAASDVSILNELVTKDNDHEE